MAHRESADQVQKRPGGRSARIRRDVLQAALDALLQLGYGRFTVADIAAASGASEATIYRRWRGLTNLIADAVGEFVLEENPIPDTGNLEEDLRQLLRTIVALLERRDVRRLLRGVMAIDAEDEVGAAARREFWRDRFERGTTIIHRAIERGDLSTDVDPDSVLEALVGPIYVRALLTEAPLADHVVEACVTAALALCAPSITPRVHRAHEVKPGGPLRRP